MRLTTFTDYCMRVLMYAAIRDGEDLVTIDDIADGYGISRNHLMKVVLRLSQLGYLQTIRGKGGGLRLGRPAASIRIGQLVRDTEEDFGLVECFHREGRPCVVEPACLLNDALGEALDAFIGVLDRYTLADLVAPRDRLARLLSIPPATPG